MPLLMESTYKKEYVYNRLLIGIIWTVHLDVRITVQVWSYLGKLCGVWTTTTTTVVFRTLLWCGNSLAHPIVVQAALDSKVSSTTTASPKIVVDFWFSDLDS